MANDEEQYRRAHYYLLAKGYYVHTDSWFTECRFLVAFYLDKANPTDEEVIRELILETCKTFEVLAVIGDLAITDINGEHPKQSYDESLVEFHLTLMNYLKHLGKNPEISVHGYLEALAQTCMTIMMKLVLPQGVYLGEPDDRILPIIKDQTII